MKKLILSSLFMTILSSAALATPSSLEGVTSRVATNTDKITDFALGKLQTLFDATTKAIPTVTKYTLQVTQMGCTITAIQDLLHLLIPGLLWYVCRKSWNKITDWGMPNGPNMLFIISGIIAVISSIIVFVDIMSGMWQFVCIVHPDIYLIHLAVQKVLGQ